MEEPNPIKQIEAQYVIELLSIPPNRIDRQLGEVYVNRISTSLRQAFPESKEIPQFRGEFYKTNIEKHAKLHCYDVLEECYKRSPPNSEQRRKFEQTLVSFAEANRFYADVAFLFEKEGRIDDAKKYFGEAFKIQNQEYQRMRTEGYPEMWYGLLLSYARKSGVQQFVREMLEDIVSSHRSVFLDKGLQAHLDYMQKCLMELGFEGKSVKVKEFRIDAERRYQSLLDALKEEG